MTGSRFLASVQILALWAAGLGAGGQFAKFSVIFSTMASVYPGQGFSLGFLVSLISALGIVLGLFAGLVVARFGYRRLLLIALILGGLISFLQSLLPSFSLMLAMRVLEGASHLVIVVATPTLIAHLAPPRWRPLAMTLWGTFFSVSFAVVAILGVPLVNAAGPAALFAAHGAYMWFTAMVLALLLPRQRALPPAQNGQFDLRRIARLHVDIYRSPFIAAPAVGWLFYTLAFVACLTLMPSAVPTESRAMVSWLMPIAGIATSMSFGVMLMRWISAYGVIMLGFGAALAVALAMLALPANPWMAVLLMAALGLVQGASFAAVPQLNETDEARAYANGAMAQTGNLGNSMGTPVLLAVILVFGPAGIVVFLTMAFAAALSVHYWMAIRRRRHG